MSESTLHAKELEARIRELQEEVQTNGQVEALEKTLRSNQERAESLEFQLSKSKQVSTPNLVLAFRGFFTNGSRLGAG